MAPTARKSRRVLCPAGGSVGKARRGGRGAKAAAKRSSGSSLDGAGREARESSSRAAPPPQARGAAAESSGALSVPEALEGPCVSAATSAGPAEAPEAVADGAWPAERLVARRVRKGAEQFRVRWAGTDAEGRRFTDADDTWEPTAFVNPPLICHLFRAAPWPLSVVEERCVAGVKRCVTLLEEPREFAMYGADLLGFLGTLAHSATYGIVRAVAFHNMQSVATRWASENLVTDLPYCTGVSTMWRIVEGLFWLDRLQLDDEAHIEACRERLREVGRGRWSVTDMIGFDPALTFSKKTWRSRYEAEALNAAFYAEGVGIPLDGWSLEEARARVLARRPWSRSLPGSRTLRQSGSQERNSMWHLCEDAYLVTHLIYTSSEWCSIQLDSCDYDTEVQFLKQALPRLLAASTKDVELVGEVVQCLRFLGVPENTPGLLEATSFLLEAFDVGTCGWDTEQASAPKRQKRYSEAGDSTWQRYHHNVCALGGLAVTKLPVHGLSG